MWKNLFDLSASHNRRRRWQQQVIIFSRLIRRKPTAPSVNAQEHGENKKQAKSARYRAGVAEIGATGTDVVRCGVCFRCLVRLVVVRSAGSDQRHFRIVTICRTRTSSGFLGRPDAQERGFVASEAVITYDQITNYQL
ncbi:hypothetical protein ZHAS_00010794 [Anopheles sinensis]|uniref:Uncharacterized protein n=1 Tax=Anopheles sinensis TaxID=74873 RepID=A0A084VY82_ANOSI|nr:hypothetical protein ZHAS_00010794 [Anopheles sinensis]